MLGLTIDGFHSRYIPQPSTADWARHLSALRAHQSQIDFEYNWTRGHKEKRVLMHSCHAIMDSAGQFKGFRGVGRDITRDRELADQVHYHATHDALTGLVNRREFDRLLTLALENASASGAKHALCFIDLDHFKRVNDTAGHQAGDTLLQELGKRFVECLRQSDRVGRLGGDEFGVLIYNCDLARAERLATQLRDVAHDYRLAWDGETYQVGASIGVVGIDADSGDLAAVLRAADMACYQSKAAGRGRISIEQGDTSQSSGGTALAALPVAPSESQAPLFREMMLPLAHDTRAEVQRVVFWPQQSVEPSWAKLQEWHAHLTAGADAVAFDVESVSACLRWLGANADELDLLDFVQLRVLGSFLDNASAFDKVSRSLAASGLARNLCLEMPASALSDVAEDKLLRLSKWGCSLCAADAAFDLRVEGLRFLQFNAEHFASALSSQNAFEQMRVRLRRAQSAGLKLQVVDVTDVRSLSALQDLGVDLIAGAAVSKAELIEL